MTAPDTHRPRATIDTNLFVSALISRGAPFALLEAWRRGFFVLVLSAQLLEEISQVLRRPYFRDHYGLTEAEIAILEERIHAKAELVDQLSELPDTFRLRDQKDRAVVQTALTGKVDFLVSGDDDLLTLDGHEALGNLRIVTVTAFLARLAASH